MFLVCQCGFSNLIGFLGEIDNYLSTNTRKLRHYAVWNYFGFPNNPLFIKRSLKQFTSNLFDAPKISKSTFMADNFGYKFLSRLDDDLENKLIESLK